MQNVNPEIKALVNDLMNNPKYRAMLIKQGPAALAFALGLARKNPKIFLRGFGASSIIVALYVYRKELLQATKVIENKAEDVLCSSGLCNKLGIHKHCERCEKLFIRRNTK